ncbi:flagellar basal-body rod protein FlgG [bacterium]|nr:MAG: flagellar basal-body rod protein FlgG [bacterium]
MMRSLNTSATGMIAQQINLDVIANNLANVNTTGFKHQRAEFQDLMYQTVQAAGAITGPDQRTPTALQIGLGTRNSSTSGDFAQGATLVTSNPTDLMITGDGFFRVRRPDESIAFTRDGSFKIDAAGDLVNTDGYAVDPAINVPREATTVTVSPSGDVQYTLPNNPETQSAGKIMVATFANPAGLTRVGQNLYLASAASGTENSVEPGTAGSGKIQGGALEASNVQIVEEMVRMIQAQRAYEINSKAIQTSDEMLNTMNSLKR